MTSLRLVGFCLTNFLQNKFQVHCAKFTRCPFIWPRDWSWQQLESGEWRGRQLLCPNQTIIQLNTYIHIKGADPRRRLIRQLPATSFTFSLATAERKAEITVQVKTVAKTIAGEAHSALQRIVCSLSYYIAVVVLLVVCRMHTKMLDQQLQTFIIIFCALSLIQIGADSEWLLSWICPNYH